MPYRSSCSRRFFSRFNEYTESDPCRISRVMFKVKNGKIYQNRDFSVILFYENKKVTNKRGFFLAFITFEVPAAFGYKYLIFRWKYENGRFVFYELSFFL